ncbi:MAG: hypothetical protein VKM68_08155 [Cyanobacteriota bacterium]|nr:hypothetical protein [Cyanobacteriota bacterium]
MNDSRLLLLVIGPNLALWGALFGGSSRPPGAGTQAMVPKPAAEPLAVLPSPAPISAITPARPPAVVPVRRPRQLRVFQPPSAAPAPTPAVIAAPPPPTPQVPLPAPLEAEPPAAVATDPALGPDVALPAEALPSSMDLREAVVRARALLPEPLDVPSPLP